MNRLSSFFNQVNFLNPVSYSFRKNLLTLSPLQKTIVLVAAAIFSCYALFLSFYRFQGKGENAKNSPLPPPLFEKEDSKKNIPDEINGGIDDGNHPSDLRINPLLDVSMNEPGDSRKRSISARLEDNRRDAQQQQGEEEPKGFSISKDLPPTPKSFYDFSINSPIDTLNPKEGIGISSTKGKRPTMEDAEIAACGWIEVQGNRFPFKLFGVFDGHGGSKASAFVKDKIQTYLVNAIRKQIKETLTEDGIFLSLKECFINLDHDLPLETEGTTATVALLINDKIWVANVGDSRTILVTKDGQTIQATEDMKPSMKTYQEKIKKLGGVVYLGKIVSPIPDSDYQNLLAVARAIGDKYMTGYNSEGGSNNKRSVSPKPKITCFPLTDFTEGHLVLACDGLYDVASSNEVGQAVHQLTEEKHTEEEISRQLVLQALNHYSKDNVTVMVVKLS